ncbi:MAG: tol-pal system-associated acyl-CoA thioesterase [Betaproteobacteria bacterium]|nr:tol-pal system-associated acyl-CoA thioesterase [Betaproteobacteria bacterium]
MRAPFSVPVRVYYQDTDAGGVVFHAQYLAFMERARTELLNARGLDLARFVAERGVQFMVHELAVRFHRPARLNDVLSVTAEVARIGAASLAFRQRVLRGDELLVEADVTLALVDRDRGRPARMPEELKKLLGNA